MVLSDLIIVILQTSKIYFIYLRNFRVGVQFTVFVAV
jgi:hypothetical protein